MFRHFLKPTPIKSILSTYNYIICGAGSAGCVLANRLSANPKNTVLLIEAGDLDNYIWIRVPLGYLLTIGNPRTDWCMKTVEDPGISGRSLLYARGKVIGGCSSINGMIYMRGQKNDYDQWANIVSSNSWNWENMLERFKKLEDFIPFNDQTDDNLFHGKAGPLIVETPRVKWKVLDIWRQAAEECGIPKVNDFNRGNNFGCSYFHVHQKMGQRVSVADAFLHPVSLRKNLHVIVNTSVAKVILNEANSKALGVEVFNRDEQNLKVISADKEVILSSGAIHSPQILQLSGIGPQKLLEKNGIKIRKRLEGVGENLQDHLQIRPVFRLDKISTLNSMYYNYFERIKIGMQYLFQKKGPITMAPSTLGAFGYSNESISTPNLQWHVQPLSLEKFGASLDRFNAITPSVCNLRPTSRGYVRINNKDFRNPPEIFLNYLSTLEDQKVAIEALKLTRKIMKSQSFKDYFPEEVRPGKDCQSDESLLEGARKNSTTIFHPIGTCKMGVSDDSMSVVDKNLKVFGISNLRVIDASIMPNITSGNTNAPTIVIADKGSDFILKDN